MKIDYSKDNLLADFSKKTLEDRYMIPSETSPQEAFARAARTFADDDEHAQRLYDYASNHIASEHVHHHLQKYVLHEQTLPVEKIQKELNICLAEFLN